MILGLHRIIVTAFLFFFLFKTVLLIAKKNDLLQSIRDKTKIIDMVLGVLIIATGVYLMVVSENHSMWINIKALAVLVSIPLGIIGMKKENVVLAIIVNLILIGAYGVGEAKPWKEKKSVEDVQIDEEVIQDSVQVEPEDSVSQSILEQNKVALSTNAKAIFNDKCTLCHGEDGRKGTLSAADLSISTMSIDEKIQIITNGRGAMVGFQDQLSKEEIETVAMYLTMLKKY